MAVLPPLPPDEPRTPSQRSALGLVFLLMAVSIIVMLGVVLMRIL